MFGVDATTTLLFFKIEVEHWSLLKTFLVYLHFMPENDLVEDTYKSYSYGTNRKTLMSRVIDALVAYRVLKLLVTPFNRTKAFEAWYY